MMRGTFEISPILYDLKILAKAVEIFRESGQYYSCFRLCFEIVCGV